MKEWAGSVLLVLVGLSLSSAQKPAMPAFVIERPTVIAFFFPVSEAELEKNPDTNEALGDFQLYVSKAGPRLKSAGIDFEVVTGRRFQVKNGRTSQTFRTGRIGIGYYFVSPGKPPFVQYGVMNDDEILETARKHLGIAIPVE